MTLPSRLRVVQLEFECTVELDDDRSLLQAEAFAEYIKREINNRSIEPKRGESFEVSAVRVEPMQ